MQIRFFLNICVAVIVTSLFSASHVSAAVFNVADGDVTGLIAAITTANGNGENDTINLAVNGSYILSGVNNTTNGPNGLPVITADSGHALVVNGATTEIGASTATGTPSFRIFNVNGGTLSISGVTISHGFLDGNGSTGDLFGAGIYIGDGVVTLTNCIFNNNAALGFDARGGAISLSSGTLRLTSCFFKSNAAISSQSFSQAGGGAIDNGFGNVTINNSTFSSNFSGIGGGIENFSTMTISNSTIEGNSADTLGGGIYSQNGHLTLTNCTISGNSVSGSNPGGGISFLDDAGGVVTIHNTIVAGNTATTAPDVNARGGAVTSQGHNFIGTADGSSGWVASDLTGTGAMPRDPLLMPLADNGGPTQTMALQSTSDAINAGDNAVLNAPFNIITDQRLLTRKTGAAVDIGAFEFGAAPIPRGDFNGDGFTDYLLFNASSRRTAVWYLQGTAFAGGVLGPSLPAGWTVSCVADIDLDGGRDLVLFNSSTRQTAVWFLRNATLLGGRNGATLPAGWNLVAAVDVNLDGKPDYVLFNPTTRQSAVWFLNGTNYTSGAFGPTLPAGWTLIDALDFNGNGKPDYLLFNPSTRKTAIWYLNGTAFSSGTYGPTLPAGWTLAGASEFNANGKPDLVLFDPSTRRTAIWFLNGATLAGGAFGPTLAAGYTLAAP
jgi:hypothetical protein